MLGTYPDGLDDYFDVLESHFINTGKHQNVIGELENCFEANGIEEGKNYVLLIDKK